MVTGEVLRLAMLTTTSPVPPGRSRLAGEELAVAEIVRLCAAPARASPLEPAATSTPQLDAATATVRVSRQPSNAESTRARRLHRVRRDRVPRRGVACLARS